MDTLPAEILYNILKNVDLKSIIKLCQTSNAYEFICSSEYDYLWKERTLDLIHPFVNYEDIQHYNNINGTGFSSWYRLYVYYALHNSKFKNGYLLDATYLGHLQMIIYLTTIHSYDTDTLISCIEDASSCGKLEIVKYLMDIGIEFKCDNSLMGAASNGHVDIVDYLIKHGTYDNTRTIPNIFVESSAKGHLNVVKHLINTGVINEMYVNWAVSRASSSDHLDTVVYLTQLPFDISQNTLNGALVDACRLNNFNMIVYLLNLGADINTTLNNTDNTPLYYCASNGCLNSVQYLVQHGADVNMGDKTPISQACSGGHLDIVKYLTEQGSDDWYLEHASMNGHLDIVKYLIEHGADVNNKDGAALRYAASYGHLDIVQYLVQHGANVHFLRDEALHRARHFKHSDVAEYLISQGSGRKFAPCCLSYHVKTRISRYLV